MTIAPSSDGTAGEIYSLECSVSVMGSADQPTITWLESGTEISSTTTRMVSGMTGSAGTYSKILTFNPLAVSHAGTYTCKAILGDAEVNEPSVVDIKGMC